MRAIIIDDEAHCIDSLSIMLERYTDVTVIKTFDSSVHAAKELLQLQAEILFLDIEMPFINGFELLTMFSKTPWKVVFTTAYDEYAVKAFKYNAIDYLMKPILREDLERTIEKLKKAIHADAPNLNEDQLIKEFSYRIKKIAIPTLAGLQMIALDDIIYLESNSNYCDIHMIGNHQYRVSKTLKIYEKKLSFYQFIRVHHSFVVNPNHITRYVKGDGGYLIMEDDTIINVSRSRKEALLKIIRLL